jgi:hypothetical protein
MAKPSASLIGDWRIVEMDLWDREYMDMEVPAFIRFEKEGGEFQFGLVSGSIDGRYRGNSGIAGVEFTWEGQDEMDAISGRGWATLESDNLLKGMLFFHGGDESGFVAKRRKAKPKGRRKS